MLRRQFLTLSIALASQNLLTGCYNMSQKKHITQFGKAFDYLKDPAFRAAEIGDQQLTIKDAFIVDIGFKDLIWKNIQFVNCNFEGGYQIKLDQLINCRFIECNFRAIINWGTQTNVHFLRCKTYTPSSIIGDRGSKNVLHEECDFIGNSTDRNHYGYVGTYGEVTFLKCRSNGFTLRGTQKLNLVEGKFDGLGISTDSFPNSGANYDRSDVTINKCVLTGTTDMVNVDLTNFTMINTQYESIDLTNATFTGDFHMEQCQGGNTKVLIKGGARNFTIKNCRIQPNGKEKFKFFIACSAQSALIDGLKIQGTDEISYLRFGAQGGIEIENGVEVIYPPKFAKKIAISNTSIPQFNFEFSAADYFLIKDCEFDRANFRQSRYKKLEIINTRISRQIDFTETKVDEQNIEFIAGFQNRIELTDGSNVRIPR